MKLKIVKGKNYDVIAAENKCVSCNGSGYYDYANPKNGKVPKCAGCNGTGTDKRSN